MILGGSCGEKSGWIRIRRCISLKIYNRYVSYKAQDSAAWYHNSLQFSNNASAEIVRPA